MTDSMYLKYNPNKDSSKMKSYRCYREIVGFKPVGRAWVYYRDIKGCSQDIGTVSMSYSDYIGGIGCLQDIEMVSVSYSDYMDGVDYSYGNEEMSIERFLKLKSHSYLLTSEGGSKEYLTFMCRESCYRELLKMFREMYGRRGWTMRSIKRNNGVLYRGKNCRINQYWIGDLEIVLNDFVGTVVRLNGLKMADTLYQLLNVDLQDLGLKFVNKDGHGVKYSYSNGKIIMITIKNMEDLINKQKTVLKVVEENS